MNYDELSCFSVEVDSGVANVTVDHPPMNLMDHAMMVNINKLGKALEADDEVSVIVVRSADPDFFVAHGDLPTLLKYRDIGQPEPETLNPLNTSLDRFRTMPKISIAQIEGQAYGGGSEFAMAMDLRFAAIGKTRLGQPEAPLGITPGAGGLSRLPDLVGRARTLEIVLGFGEFNAELAERYGWVNRALPANEIGEFVTELARRIASNSPDVIAAIKQTINKGSGASISDRLLDEQVAYEETANTDAARLRMERALEIGLQDRESEKAQLDEILVNLGAKK